MRSYAKEKKMGTRLDDLISEFGGYWGVGHPEYALDNWRCEVANNDTRKGYWSWVYTQVEEE